jgi:isoleucyl-tRNA synthetase
MFDAVDPKQPFPDLEKMILASWRAEDTFRRSQELRKDRERFGFYDGPPFATGLPHYGHLLAGTIKDVIPRYRTMRGNFVQRRFGWDCHGLPVENLVEKEHNLKSKKDIEEIGIEKFNALCRASVLRYAAEWRATVERMGRWVDMDWDYRTMDPPYMESIWWVMDRLYEKNLLYEGHKPMHICPRCVTPLSNFEVTQGYKEVTDKTATVMFELQESKETKESKDSKEEKTYLLAWTTTPWTLPGNLFVAVNPDATYVLAKPKDGFGGVEGKLFVNKKDHYIASKQYFESLHSFSPDISIESFEVIRELK